MEMANPRPTPSPPIPGRVDPKRQLTFISWPVNYLLKSRVVDQDIRRPITKYCAPNNRHNTGTFKYKETSHGHAGKRL